MHSTNYGTLEGQVTLFQPPRRVSGELHSSSNSPTPPASEPLIVEDQHFDQNFMSERVAVQLVQPHSFTIKSLDLAVWVKMAGFSSVFPRHGESDMGNSS